MYSKIVIVDDDEVSTFLTEATLAEENFADAYECFLSGAEALASLIPILEGKSSAVMPNLILLDLNMPHVSGWDFLDSLTPYASKLQQVCRIYILSSSVDEAEMARAQENELVSGFLHKPLLDDSILLLRQACN